MLPFTDSTTVNIYMLKDRARTSKQSLAAAEMRVDGFIRLPRRKRRSKTPNDNAEVRDPVDGGSTINEVANK
eukprot:IDg10648t1